MKSKISLICVILLVALGGLGIAYAGWTDVIHVDGTVYTGEVKLGFTSQFGEEEPECDGDYNFDGEWVWGFNRDSCPEDGQIGLDAISIAPECKDVGNVTAHREDRDSDGVYETMVINITGAYPLYLVEFTCHIGNYGTIPAKIYPVISITQSDGILIDWGNSQGVQLEPGEDRETSFYIAFPQHLPVKYCRTENDCWWVMEGALLPENTNLSFTITLGGIQWNEYEPLQ